MHCIREARKGNREEGNREGNRGTGKGIRGLREREQGLGESSICVCGVEVEGENRDTTKPQQNDTEEY